MELCLSTSQVNSQVPCRRFICANTHIESYRPFAAINFKKAGLFKYSTSLLRATTSEEGSSGINGQFDSTPGFFDSTTGVVATMEEPSDEINKSSDTTSDAVPKEESSVGATGVVATMEEPSDEINKSSDTTSDAVPKEESPKEESSAGESSQLSEFLEQFNLKLDLEDNYSVLVYGSGALVALWLTSAVVGAIDSIPVFPKVLELVGLSYTVWFSSRYLIFKENRDELSARIEELKQQVIGSSDD